MNRCDYFSMILVVLVVFFASTILICTPTVKSERTEGE